MEAVKGSIYEAGRLEILHFVPPDCLGQADLEHMELDEFLHYLAMARYIQELESAIIQRGVVSAFPEE
ncbi:MAG: hypothetical protein KH110_10340 [Clostridiales bacterium]|nr:hypothetical protein [Clostridiales bacterium]